MDDLEREFRALERQVRQRECSHPWHVDATSSSDATPRFACGVCLAEIGHSSDLRELDGLVVEIDGEKLLDPVAMGDSVPVGQRVNSDITIIEKL